LKKEPKNFCKSGLSLSCQAEAKRIKVFCFFFSKKKAFFFYFTPAQYRPAHHGNPIVDGSPGLLRRERSPPASGGEG
jgi:hypothetical protein